MSIFNILGGDWDLLHNKSLQACPTCGAYPTCGHRQDNIKLQPKILGIVYPNEIIFPTFPSPCIQPINQFLIPDDHVVVC